MLSLVGACRGPLGAGGVQARQVAGPAGGSTASTLSAGAVRPASTGNAALFLSQLLVMRACRSIHMSSMVVIECQVFRQINFSFMPASGVNKPGVEYLGSPWDWICTIWMCTACCFWSGADSERVCCMMVFFATAPRPSASCLAGNTGWHHLLALCLLASCATCVFAPTSLTSAVALAAAGWLAGLMCGHAWCLCQVQVCVACMFTMWLHPGLLGQSALIIPMLDPAMLAWLLCARYVTRHKSKLWPALCGLWNKGLQVGQCSFVPTHLFLVLPNPFVGGLQHPSAACPAVMPHILGLDKLSHG